MTDNLCFGSEVCPIPDYHIISCEYCPAYIPEKIIPQNEQWSSRQWDYVQQITAEVLHYRKEHSKLMVEVDKLLLKKKKKYNAYE